VHSKRSSSEGGTEEEEEEEEESLQLTIKNRARFHQKP